MARCGVSRRHDYQDQARTKPVPANRLVRANQRWGRLVPHRLWYAIGTRKQPCPHQWVGSVEGAVAVVPLLLTEPVPDAEPLAAVDPGMDAPLPSAFPSVAGLIGDDPALGRALTALCNGASVEVAVGVLGRLGWPLAPELVAEVTPPTALCSGAGADVPVGRLGKDELPGKLDKLGKPLEPGLVTDTVPPALRLLVPVELEVVDNVSGPLVVVNEPLELEPPLSGSSALPAVSSTVLTGAGAGGVLSVVPAAETVTELSAAVTVKGTVAVPPF